ncbi:MAG TPA: hypothetical protein VEV43_14155, partial [Actinomycetota bacterium]|nr:hypothetical protein [Actinomycetota bacterium]
MPKSIPPRTTGAVCALLVLSLMGSAAATPAGSGREIPPVLLGLIETATDKGEIRLLVSVRDMAAQRTVLDTIDKSDARVLHRYEILPYLLLEAGPDTVRSLVHDPLVTGFTEDLPEKATLDSSIPVVNGDDVRALGLRGGGTAVAILDSGIDLDHPFLGNVVSEACYSDFTGTSSGTSLCDGGAHSDVGPGAADVESGGDEPCISSGTNICSHG